MEDFKTLQELKSGESGVVVEIKGGFGLVRNLESMGLRCGKKITKVSAQFFRGPQVIKLGNMQIALGFGMSKRVVVQVSRGAAR